jgi:hypothetical protein
MINLFYKIKYNGMTEKESELKTVFLNGKITQEFSLKEIRARLK